MEALDWHARFLQQAHWTRNLRVYLFLRAGLEHARRVLEVGCGTGAVLGDLTDRAAVHGLDLSLPRLSQARLHAPAASLACGDALHLPYADATFDLTFCHFLLLWVQDPLQALLEMRRVTCRGGYVLALAEPDYTLRQDAPPELEFLGELQNESLRRQGADIGLGGRLADLFARAGILPIESGALAAAESEPSSPREWEQEWAVMESDLTGLLSGREIRKYKALDIQARRAGTRRLHVPTFFAWGRV